MPSMYILPIPTYDVPSGESDPLIADFSVMKLEKRENLGYALLTEQVRFVMMKTLLANF